MHTRAGVAMSCMEEGLLPLNQISRRFFNRVTHHDFGGIALDLAERERIIADPGSCPVMVPRNHGLIVPERSAAEMYNNMFHLGGACEIQITALSTQCPLRRIGGGEHVVAQYAQMSFDDGDLMLEWEVHLRSNAGRDRDYRL
ncbi:class II aldolase/adducin family protein [Paenirhodobacter populi]|uniref:class II aldolase/adducin family protein n=1 Tax=Paenirhodobacter populi TaxID=2306993 RepID=UPI001F4E8923|nr:class II aldolase/adducin family protein [Sinirhodobacter populi]